MALSLVLCKNEKNNLSWSYADPRVPHYSVARGRLPRTEYCSQEATLKVFLTATSIFPSSLTGHYPTKYKFHLVHCGGRQVGQPRPVLISSGQMGILGTHMNNLRVFHHNTPIVYNSASHLDQNRMESRSRRTVMKESHSKETARPRDKPL